MNASVWICAGSLSSAAAADAGQARHAASAAAMQTVFSGWSFMAVLWRGMGVEGDGFGAGGRALARPPGAAVATSARPR